MSDELVEEARELAALPAPPDIPGAPEWQRAGWLWLYGLERERRLAEIRRRAVYEAERRGMEQVLADTQSLAAQMAEVGSSLTHAIAGLKDDIRTLRRDVAKIASKVDNQGGSLAALLERVDAMEHEIDKVKLELGRLLTRERPTMPPEPTGRTDPAVGVDVSEPGGES